MTRWFVRAGEPEAVEWHDCPDYRARRLMEEGMTEVDRDAFRVHLRAFRGAGPEGGGSPERRRAGSRIY